MTDADPPAGRDDDRPGGSDDRPGGSDDRPTGIVRALLDLLAEMDERGERRRRGRWSGERTTVDYSVSIGGLDDAWRLDDASGAGPGGARGSEPTDVRGSGADHDRWAHALTTRELDDGIVVVADLPGVPAEDVAVDIDDDARTVTIAVDGDVLGYVPLDDGDWTVVDVSHNNQVLEVTLTHE